MSIHIGFKVRHQDEQGRHVIAHSRGVFGFDGVVRLRLHSKITICGDWLLEIAIAYHLGGIDAAVFLASEKLPVDAHAAAVVMANWREPGFWFANDGNKSASFQFGIAAKLERPVVVIEKMGKNYLNPARIYGARDATTGELIHSVERPGAPETVPSYELLPIADLLAKLQSSPTGYSMVEFNGSNHFNPRLLEPSLRKAVIKTVTAPAAADLRMQIAVTWFPDPVFVAEFRIRHYAAELKDSGIQKYKTGIVHISLRAVYVADVDPSEDLEVVD